MRSIVFSPAPKKLVPSHAAEGSYGTQISRLGGIEPLVFDAMNSSLGRQGLPNEVGMLIDIDRHEIDFPEQAGSCDDLVDVLRRRDPIDNLQLSRIDVLRKSSGRSLRGGRRALDPQTAPALLEQETGVVLQAGFDANLDKDPTLWAADATEDLCDYTVLAILAVDLSMVAPERFRIVVVAPGGGQVRK